MNLLAQEHLAPDGSMCAEVLGLCSLIHPRVLCALCFQVPLKMHIRCLEWEQQNAQGQAWTRLVTKQAQKRPEALVWQVLLVAS